MATARVNFATAMGASVAAVALGGGAPTYAVAEEFTADAALSTITVS